MILVNIVVAVFVTVGVLGGFLYVIGLMLGVLAGFGDKTAALVRAKGGSRGRRSDRNAGPVTGSHSTAL